MLVSGVNKKRPLLIIFMHLLADSGGLKIIISLALAGWPSWLKSHPVHQKAAVRFPVGEHT